MDQHGTIPFELLQNPLTSEYKTNHESTKLGKHERREGGACFRDRASFLGSDPVLAEFRMRRVGQLSACSIIPGEIR